MLIDFNYELEKYLLSNLNVREQYEQLLIKDAEENELTLTETRNFVEECITSFDHFEMFMPFVARQLKESLINN